MHEKNENCVGFKYGDLIERREEKDIALGNLCLHAELPSILTLIYRLQSQRNFFHVLYHKIKITHTPQC